MASIGLIGKGYWGQILLAKVQRGLGDLRFVSSGRDVADYLDRLRDLDWAFIATPNKTHFEIAQNCLSRGVNVFCEKPLTADPDKSAELYALASRRGVRLYVDDVFRFRDETKLIRSDNSAQNIRQIVFMTKKYGSFKDGIFNNLAYHDLSVLFDFYPDLDFRDLVFEVNEFNRKRFKFRLGQSTVSFEYDRLFSGKDKRTIVDGRVYDYNTPSNDALEEMLGHVLAGSADFEKNREMCLSVDRALKKLNQYEVEN